MIISKFSNFNFVSGFFYKAYFNRVCVELQRVALPKWFLVRLSFVASAILGRSGRSEISGKDCAGGTRFATKLCVNWINLNEF